jgi:uncharacterized protein (DUF1015 family)
VFPTHRVVSGLANFQYESLVERTRARFEVEVGKVADAAQTRHKLAELGKKGPSVAAVAGDKIAYLTLKRGADLSQVPSLKGPAVLRELDVTLLHALIIEDILGISRADQEKQTNLKYVKDTQKALDEAKNAQVVFVMNPTPVDHVRRVADAGEVMPQKATYFYPKIASGLVVNPLDPAESV